MRNIYENIEKTGDLVLPFKGCDNINDFYSQAGQDIFVLSVLDGKNFGAFVDIGCNDPESINNTYLLESKFDWRGFLIDNDEHSINLCKQQRKSVCMLDDATKINYKELLGDFSHIDYVSIDLDGITSLQALCALPLDKISVITFEHAFYLYGDLVKTESRKYMDSAGFHRICTDVKHQGFEYEDWYISPNVYTGRIKPLISDKKEGIEIIFR